MAKDINSYEFGTVHVIMAAVFYGIVIAMVQLPLNYIHIPEGTGKQTTYIFLTVATMAAWLFLTIASSMLYKEHRNWFVTIPMPLAKINELMIVKLTWHVNAVRILTALVLSFSAITFTIEGIRVGSFMGIMFVVTGLCMALYLVILYLLHARRMQVRKLVANLIQTLVEQDAWAPNLTLKENLALTRKFWAAAILTQIKKNK